VRKTRSCSVPGVRNNSPPNLLVPPELAVPVAVSGTRILQRLVVETLPDLGQSRVDPHRSRAEPTISVFDTRLAQYGLAELPDHAGDLYHVARL